MTNYEEHYNNLKNLFDKTNGINIVLDAGSGRTTLKSIKSYYANALIDAIVFPGDLRKINSIKENIADTNYNLIEMDICKDKINKKYDLVLAHLLLGEAVMWGNSFENLLKNLLQINSKYFIIYDFIEDPSINYEYLEKYLIENKFEIIYKQSFVKLESQQFINFIGKNYIGYLIKK